MASKNYFIYDADSNLSLDELQLPQDTLVLVFGTPESYDALSIIQQGLPQRPFLASQQEDNTWVITYF